MASACPRNHKPCGQNQQSCCPILQEGTERPTGNVPNKLDILFVLNTMPPSWYPNFNIRRRFQSFIPTMNNPSTDWRVFFIKSHYSNSDGQSGKAMNLNTQALPDTAFLDRSVPDNANVFAEMIVRGLRGEDRYGRPYSCSSTNSPFNCNYGHPLKALKASFAANRHLVRKKAVFLAIIVSNRDEQGEEINAEDIIREFENIYGPDKRLSVWALIVLPGDTNCFYNVENLYRNVSHPAKKHFGDYGYQIANLVKKTEGEMQSICLEDHQDYSELARRITTRIDQRIDQ